LIGLAVAAMAGAASASTSGGACAPGDTCVAGSGGTVVQVKKAKGFPGGVLNLPAGSGSVTAPSGGSDYNAYVHINPTTVTFESADAVSGRTVTSTSTSAVDITFTNTGPKAITPVFNSDIVPAGLGFYLNDTSSGCGGDVIGGCPSTKSGYSFINLKYGGQVNPAGFGMVSFDFSILADNVPVYDLNGSMTLSRAWVPTVNLSDVNGLNNFRLATPVGSSSDVGYAWDETPLSVQAGGLLQPGASRTLTYQVTVTSFTDTLCINPTTCLVAYSGFGDPVGRTGGINSVGGALGPSFQDTDPTTGLSFSPATFNLPQFKGGQLNFFLTGTPEPDAWLMLLLGTAMTGATLRGARRARAAA
jgi:hypothetical protein